MKKFLALLLAMMMVLFTFGALASEIPDNMTSEDGKYVVAMVTDVGSLKDKSFNEGTWDGVKLYATEHGLSYKYYQPANGNAATDDDRYDAMKMAIDNGAEIIVTPGFMQEGTLRKIAPEYPDVKFVFIDGTIVDIPNIASISFAEHQSGFLAGYAVVKDGFEKLGFSGGGGGTNPACARFGYGFAQGANAAAKEMGKTVELKYTWQYGSTFTANPDLQVMMEGWYGQDTEIVFACGGTIFDSIAAAAAANDGFVVGVDKDQSGDSDTVITSAMKGITSASKWAVEQYFNGVWDEIGGKATQLGAEADAVGLPTAAESWRFENYTVEEYEAQFAAIKAGELVIDNADMFDNAIETAGLDNLVIKYE